MFQDVLYERQKETPAQEVRAKSTRRAENMTNEEQDEQEMLDEAKSAAGLMQIAAVQMEKPKTYEEALE